MSNPLVIYHAGCFDGWCSAWLVWKAFPDAEFFPAQYGQKPPDTTGRECYIVDFSYKRQQMIDIIDRAVKVVVLDHHESAEKELCDLYPKDHGLIRFDMAKSGGRLTWEYLWDRGLVRSPRVRNSPPWLVSYTEDRDLWLWKLTDSKAVNAALRTYPMDFKVWDDLETRNPTSMVAEGSAILRAEAQTVASHVKNATEVVLDGHKILCCNATTLMSEIGNELCKGRPFSATYFIRGDGQKVWSLRSDENGLNVSDIARKFGGGGHPRAAGFQTKPEEIL